MELWSDLVIALRLLERKATPVLSTVRIGDCDLGSNLGHTHLDYETHSGIICVTNSPPIGVEYDRLEGTLVLELDHLAAQERGILCYSGAWAERWLYPWDKRRDGTYHLALRRYYQRFSY